MTIDLEESSSREKKKILAQVRVEKEVTRVDDFLNKKIVVESSKEFVEVIKNKIEIEKVEEVINKVLNELKNIPCIGTA